MYRVHGDGVYLTRLPWWRALLAIKIDNKPALVLRLTQSPRSSAQSVYGFDVALRSLP